MIGFQADAPVPPAARIRVTLAQGLADLHGHSLAEDYAWTFETAAIELKSDLLDHRPGPTDQASDLQPVISINSTVELGEASLLANAVLVEADTQGAGRVTLVRKAQPSPSPNSAGDASGPEHRATFTYLLTPGKPLREHTTYQLRVGPDVRPARGNLATDRMADGWLRTRGPLSFTRLSVFDVPRDHQGQGRFLGGAPRLEFTNDLDEKSLAKAVSIAPAPIARVNLARADANAISIAPDALAPHTHYAITVSGDVQDRFGQRLEKPVTVHFTTSDLAADFWAPDGSWLYPTAQNIRLNVDSTNSFGSRFQSAYRALTPTDLIFADPQSSLAREKLLVGTPRSRVNVRSQHNAEVQTPLDVRSPLTGKPGMVAYAFEGRTNEFINADHRLSRLAVASTGVVGFTNIGLFAQWFPGGGLVRTHHLSDGSPIANARIDVYESQLDESRARHATVPCAAGTTDAGGTWQLDSATFGRCAMIRKSERAGGSSMIFKRALAALRLSSAALSMMAIRQPLPPTAC